MQTSTYEIQELVELTGVPRRNIYFYVQQGLLPPPAGAGLAARYNAEHLLRLRLLPLLRRKGLKLDQIRLELDSMDAAEMQALLEREQEEPGNRAPEAVPPPLAAGLACTRYDLPGGILLLVPAGLPARHRALVEELLAVGGIREQGRGIHHRAQCAQRR